MGIILILLHLACAAVLFTAHGIFLLRGFPIEAGRITPGKLDSLARTLSQLFLAVTALSGLILRLAANRMGRDSALHLILGLTPLAAIPLIYFGRVLLKKRRELPWLLPVVNLILLTAAGVTGIIVWR